LDLAKSFTIIVSMIGIHTMCHLASFEQYNLPENILNILATAWGAPVFMFCMGITLGFSHHHTIRDWHRRGIHLLTIGMVLNVFRYLPIAYTSQAVGNPELMKELAQVYNVDILQFAGLAFLLLAICQKIKMGPQAILVLALLMNFAGTQLIGHYTSSYVANQILGLFYHTPTCSCFPLFNWFIFVAAGNVLGKFYKKSENIDFEYRFILPISGIIAIVHQYLSITGKSAMFTTLQNDWEFYNMSTPDAVCIAFGVAPFMIGFFRLISKIIPNSWLNVLSYSSRHINQFFCVSWVLIMWTYSFLYFIEPAVTFGGFVLRWLAIVLLTTLCVFVYNRYIVGKIGQYFTDNRGKWTIAVWAFAIAFGIWYFNSIPEPYVMPY